MIVDDNARMRKMIVKVLQDQLRGTMTFHEYANGAESVKRYPALQPDWVIMDVRLQGFDGVSATREILRNHPGAKIIILSHFNESEYRLAANDVGARASFAKDDLGGLVHFMQNASN